MTLLLAAIGVAEEDALSRASPSPMWRAGSPSPGGSTLITSAPWSAITCDRCGPGRNSDRSRTRTPSSFIRPLRARAAPRSRRPSSRLRAAASSVCSPRPGAVRDGRRAPSSLIGFASTRKSGRAGCGSVRTMPIAARVRVVERLRAGRRPEPRAAGPAGGSSQLLRSCARTNSASRTAVSASRLRAARVRRREARVRREVRRAEYRRASACQNFSVMHMTKIQPSAVRNSCTGTADGCELRGRRSVRWPSFRYQLPG